MLFRSQIAAPRPSFSSSLPDPTAGTQILSERRPSRLPSRGRGGGARSRRTSFRFGCTNLPHHLAGCTREATGHLQRKTRRATTGTANPWWWMAERGDGDAARPRGGDGRAFVVVRSRMAWPWNGHWAEERRRAAPGGGSSRGGGDRVKLASILSSSRMGSHRIHRHARVAVRP